MENENLAPAEQRQASAARAGGPLAYDHSRYARVRGILLWLLRNIGFRFLARMDHARISGLENLPAAGPAILMINHIAFIDPIVVLTWVPRQIVPLAKAEVHRIPVWGFFTRLWNVITVHRDELDRRALEQALRTLAAGEVILIAPEATRRRALAEGREGVAYLGYKSGATIIPVAVENTTGYPTLLGPWNRKRPGAWFRLGRPFRYKPVEGRVRGRLRLMTDEAMYQLAALLPEHRRGFYADLDKATTDTIELL